METLTSEQLAKEGQAAYQAQDYPSAARLYQAAADSFLAVGDELKVAEMANNCSVAWLKAGNAQAAFDAARLPVLYNQGLSIGVGKAVLYLAGMDDGWSGHPDLRLALEQAPTGAPVILLLHEPDLADETLRDPRISLQLSGHTHGGQVWPFDYISRQYFPLFEGRYQVSDMTVIVCRGTGTWGPRMRLWRPGEIVRITLKAGTPHAQ